MNYQFKLIEVGEYLEFFDLIDNNRERLQKYFPLTMGEITSITTAKQHLQENLLKRQKKEKYLFGVYDQKLLIGYINVKNIDWRVPKCELGYFMDRSYGGKQIMTQKIGEVCAFCFTELKMMKIYLRIGKENLGSLKVAEKNGFIREGILRKEFRLACGELIDVWYYGRLNESMLTQ